VSKIIASINMTLDGYCDHTAIVPDDDVHNHYKNMLDKGGTILFGRITYQLMEFWLSILENPTDVQSMNDFAKSIDKIQKIVFSNTLKNVEWKSAILANRDLFDVVNELKVNSSKDIYIGSRSLIIQLMNRNVIDEYQICVHPVVVGSGLPLFDKIQNRTILKLTKTQTLKSGAVILYYEPFDK
jgi:dihydrofolate reductase